jgi:hypothetical protein
MIAYDCIGREKICDCAYLPVQCQAGEKEYKKRCKIVNRILTCQITTSFANVRLNKSQYQHNEQAKHEFESINQVFEVFLGEFHSTDQ